MPKEIDYVIYRADWLEVLWISVTLVALVVNTMLLRIGLDNRRALVMAQQNGLRKYAIDTQIIRELLRILIQLCLLAIGIRAVLTINLQGIRTWDTYLAIGLLMAIPIVNMIKAIVDWYRFTVLLRRVEEGDSIELRNPSVADSHSQGE